MDRRALVTGAAQGLGRAVAELFIARGARVVLTDVRADALKRTVADLGASAHAVICDVPPRTSSRRRCRRPRTPSAGWTSR